MIPHRKSKKFFLLIPLSILLLLPLVIMLLWNSVVTAIFGIKCITYLQAMGLFVLSRILFGNFGFGSRPAPPFRKQGQNRFLDMSDEEKNKMMQEWKKRSGCE